MRRIDESSSRPAADESAKPSLEFEMRLEETLDEYGERMCMSGIRTEAAPVASKDAVTLSDDEIESLWIMRTHIHEGNLMPQLVDFARSVLKAQRDASKAEAKS